MATNIKGTGNGIPREHNRPLPENPPNFRPGITGQGIPGGAPNTKNTYRQRNELLAHQAPNQTSFVGTNPANLHLKPNDNQKHQEPKASTPSLLVDSRKDSGRLDELMYGPRSPSLTGNEQDLGNLNIDDNDGLTKLSVDDDLLKRKDSEPSVRKDTRSSTKEILEPDDDEPLDDPNEARKKKPRKDLRGMLGGFKPPSNRGGKDVVGHDFNTGLFDLKPQHREDQNAIDPKLVGRAEIGVPNAKASTGLRATGGAAAGAVVGTATGAAVGATFGGTVLASVAIGAGIGSVGFGVGAVVGAGVGLIVGIGLGIAYGRASAKRAKADYLDTSQQGTVQRASGHGLTRSLMPKQLGRRLLRAIKPSSRSWLGRIWNGVSGCCKGGKKIKMEDRGRNARASEARQDLRYAVASHVAYSMGGPGTEGAEFSKNATADEFQKTNRAADWVPEFQHPVDDLSEKQVSNLLKKYAKGYPPSAATNPKAHRAYTRNRRAYDRKLYTGIHKTAVRRQGAATMTKAAFEKNEGATPWDFKTVGPNAMPGTREHDIFKRLPASLQQSLTDGQGVFRDPDTGNNVRIIYDNENDEVLIAYNGTGGGGAAFGGAFVGTGGDATERAQNRTNISNYAGGTPPSVKQAVAIGKAVREAVQKYNDDNRTNIGVVSTGHSRGGLLATAEAVKNRGKAVTFNPEAMGSGIRDYCGIYSNNRVPDEVDITVYSTRNELASGKGWASGLGTAAEFTLGWLPVPVIGVPPVIIGDRRILPQAPGFAAHPDQVMHMSNLAGGAQPPPKAWMNWSAKARRDSLYVPEPDRARPRSNREVFKDNVTYLGTTQGQMSLIGHPVMKRNGVKAHNLDYDEFEHDLANAAELVLSTRRGDIDPDDTKLLDQALHVAIGINMRRQRADWQSAASGNRPPVKNRVDVEEERPLKECVEDYQQLVISAADDKSLLDEVMNTPMMQNKNYDLDTMDRSRFRQNLAKCAKIFAQGVTSEDKIRSQAITAIATAINRTMKNL